MDVWALAVFFGVVLAALIAFLWMIISGRAKAREVERALQASVRRDKERTETPRPRERPHVRAGSARGADWDYSGSAKDHFAPGIKRGHVPPRPLPPRPHSKSEAKRHQSQADDSSPSGGHIDTYSPSSSFAGGGGRFGGAGASGSWDSGSSSSGDSSSGGSTD